jgi:hypothetical protein
MIDLLLSDRLYRNSFQNLKLSLEYEYLFLLTTFSAFSDLRSTGAVYIFDFSAL